MRKLFLAAIPLLVGCGAPYKFVAHAEPNPFVTPGCRAVLEPIHVEHLMIGDKPVQQYLAEKKAESADSFDGDIRDSNEIFRDMFGEEHGSLFVPGAPQNTFTIRPTLTDWEPGYYAFVAAAPGVANLTVDVLSPSGQVLDRITIEAKSGAGSNHWRNSSWSDISSGGRMRNSLRRAGKALSRYVEDNWMCARH